MTHRAHEFLPVLLGFLLVACGDAATTTGTTGSGGAGGSGATTSTSGTTGSGGAGGGTTTSTSGTTGSGGASNDCALIDGTTETATVNAAGCHVTTRDTSACEAARTAQGLSGFWLDFSCRLTLTAATEAGVQVVKIETDNQPEHLSNYFPAGNVCHEDFPGGMQNPNQIVAKTYVIPFPLAPGGASQTMKGSAIVGMAVDGVVVFGNFAAPGDDIYQEAKTFDRCGGHPQMTGVYHYHSEPNALTYDDPRLVGVMRDGYPIYGRKDSDSTYPTLDMYGGHSGVTPHSDGASVYHYHVNEQTSTNPTSAGTKQWFLTTGTYKATPASCAACK